MEVTQLKQSHELVMINEEDIGIESPDNGTGISVRVSSNSHGRSNQRTLRMSAEPGNAVRVSIGFSGDGASKNKRTVRALVYVDPISGEGCIRIGGFVGSREEGKQLVYRTDKPVWKGNK